MDTRYPQARAGAWWRDESLWVQVAIQVIVFTVFGIVFLLRPNIWAPWQVALDLAGLAVTFAGLIIQRWHVEPGLAATAAGLACLGASLMPTYLLPYFVVCYEAWYIAAFARRRARAWLAALCAGSVAAVGAGAYTQWWKRLDELSPQVAGIWAVVAMLAVVSIALFGALGRRTADRADKIEALAARAELASLAERNRIAREMHDIVAHSLTVIIAQADGGRYAARKDPGSAVSALEVISEQGRGALAQMRSLLSVLHDGAPADRDVAAAPGVSAIPGLVDDAARAGLKVDFEVRGEPLPLDDATGLTVFRIVQKSLTNVLKHAGPVATRVRLEWADRLLRVTVDNRPGHGRIAGSGRGLAGLADRVHLHGGSVEWGESGVFAGGWNVTATVPVRPVQQSPGRQE